MTVPRRKPEFHPRVAIVTMGCSKNLVDSERLAHKFEKAGWEVIFDPEGLLNAEVAIINTCGFIGDAKEESIGAIFDWIGAKERGQVGKVFVMGCLSQRYQGDISAEMPEVDGWYGKWDWIGILKSLGYDKKRQEEEPWQRKLSTPGYTAYIKIAEGCNRHCAFCAIPIITGRYQSRPIEEVVQEVAHLAAQGVKEFNIIAQDLSSYGMDLYHGEQRLADLVEALCEVQGVKWLRLHYLYPAQFPPRLLEVMAANPQVCRYMDIALQHCADPVLKAMRRHITGAQTEALLEEIRRKVPDIHIRTTLMVGFPGEGEAEFQQLLDFVRRQRFDRMGAFAYCPEEGTFAGDHLEDTVSQEEKQHRLDQLMEIQGTIALELNEAKVGETMRVLMEEENPEDGTWSGRTEFDSPEVDPEVIVTVPQGMEKPNPGDMVQVIITGADEYELMGTLVKA